MQNTKPGPERTPHYGDPVNPAGRKAAGPAMANTPNPQGCTMSKKQTQGWNRCAAILSEGGSLAAEFIALERALLATIPAAPPVEISQITRDAAGEISEIRKSQAHPCDDAYHELSGFCHALLEAVCLANKAGVSFRSIPARK